MATFRLSSGTSSAAPASFVPVVGDYTVVYVYAIGNSNTAPTCSDDNGGTYTLITAQLLNASGSVLSLFVRDQPFSNTTATTITPSVGAATSWRATFESYSGMLRSGSSGVRQFAVQANQASGTTPAATFSVSALTANPTLGGVADATTLTAPTSWTSQASGGKLQVVTRDSGFTGTTITWGSTDGADYATIIVELDASLPPVSSDEAFAEVVDRALLSYASFSLSRPGRFVQQEERVTPIADRSLTRWPPDGYRLGLVRMNVGLGYLSDVEYYVAAPSTAAPQLEDVNGFALRVPWPWTQVRDTRFTDQGELPVALPSFDATLSSTAAGKGPFDSGHQVVTSPIPVVVSAVVGGTAQTNGDFWVTIFDNYGANVISGVATTALAGWSETGWTLSAGIWRNHYTLASAAAGTYALGVQISLGLNTGVVGVSTSAIYNVHAPKTDQATGVGNDITVHIYAT